MARSVDRVRDFFQSQQLPLEVRELPASTRTAPLAAAAVGSELGQIVKSLILIDDADRTILALVAGDRRADERKIANFLAAGSVRIARADEVRARTGYAIGGVPPVAHGDGAIYRTVMDDSLRRFHLVWAAAGAPNAVFPIETDRLIELSGADTGDITVTAA
jgi:prolyl-tRNA editing enzyme YbaK/EbsC (Cys-tRNA(Pro) deacylase)